MNENVRQSSRTKKLSSAMRRVDEETRQMVLRKRLDKLEGDRLFDEIMYGVSAADDDEGWLGDGAGGADPADALGADDWKEEDEQSDEEDDDEISDEDEDKQDADDKDEQDQTQAASAPQRKTRAQ